MDNKIVNLDEYINTKKFGDAESRKELLEIIKSGFDSVSNGISFLTDSFDVNEENAKCDTEHSISILVKQADISTHMIIAIDEIEKIYKILEELIEEKEKEEK